MGSMLRSKMGELWRTLVQRRQLVGIDTKGNKYYIWQQQDYKGDYEERREVQLFEPLKDMASYDPSCVPVEWRSWLRGHRRAPPSLQDSARLQEYRDKMRTNAEAVQQAEEKERLRRATLGTQVQGPEMDAFLRQLGGEKMAAEARAREAGHAGAANDGKPSQGAGESSGAGDSFQPGQWTPGKS